MPEPFIIYPTGMIGDVLYNPGVPMVGAAQKAPMVTPLLPGQVFTALTKGEYAVDRVTGRQGAMDLWFKTGAAGSTRALATLLDQPTGRYVQIFLGTTNAVNLAHYDATGVLKAQITDQLGAEGTGVPLRYRYSWDSTRAIDGTRFALFRKIDTAVSTWAVDPQAAWTSFNPTHVFVGFAPAGIGSASEFNGTIQKVQVGSQVVTT